MKLINDKKKQGMGFPSRESETETERHTHKERERGRDRAANIDTDTYPTTPSAVNMTRERERTDCEHPADDSVFRDMKADRNREKHTT
jgi:hypothetical protein